MHTDRSRMVSAIILAYLTVLGTAVNLEIPESKEYLIIQLIKAVKGFSLTQLFLFAGLCVLYICAFQCIKNVDWTLREKILVLIPAALFAGFMIVGYSFAQTDSWDLIFKGFLKKIKAVFAFAGYGIAFTILIAWFYTWLHGLNLVDTGEQMQKERGLLEWYKNILAVAPFRTTFLTLLIVYIPYAILSYPAIFMGDSKNIIAQGFNLPEGTSNYLNLIDGNVRLNGHHPIIYTEFIHICLVVGKTVFNSYNVGIFLVSLTQLFGVCAVVAMSVRLLTQLRIRENILLVLIVYFSFAPQIQNYMFLNAKDVLAACAMLVFLMSAFKIVWNKACVYGGIYPFRNCHGPIKK